MFEIRAASFVAYLGRHFVDRDYKSWTHNRDGSWVKPGVLVQLDCRMADYERDVKRGADFWFVMCGNTNTFAYHSADREGPKPEQYRNISNHDSCWRSAIDDYLDRVYFDFAKQINPDKAPKDLSQFCFIGFSRHQLVDVHAAPDRTHETLGGRFKITALKPRAVAP